MVVSSMPPPKSKLILSDNFNRADADLVAPWVKCVGSPSGIKFGVVSNQLRNTGGIPFQAGPGDCYIYDVPLSGLDQYVQSTEIAFGSNSSTDNGSVVARAGNSPAGSPLALHGRIYGNGWTISTNTLGGSSFNTDLASGAGSYTPGGILRMEVSGTTVLLKYNGSTIGNYTGTIPTGLYTGTGIVYINAVHDNWEAGDL